MKKLFGRERDKAKDLVPPPTQSSPAPTPIHHQYTTQRPSVDDERWEMLNDSHNATAPVPASSRAPSPYTVSANSSVRQPPIPAQVSGNGPTSQAPKKKGGPPALGILNSLEPQQNHHARNRSEEPLFQAQPEPPKEKKGFWSRDKEKDREKDNRDREIAHRERERMEQDPRDRDTRERGTRDYDELTRKIGFLTATASEDWTLVLDVCEHASSSDAAAKEAVRALRREFKYGEPAAQLAAARLWALMLRNSTDTFISQSTSRKFLDTLEDLLTSSRTAPVVKERLMDVLGAAAFASGGKKDTGFRGLWRRVKPRDRPEEGVPFDPEDVMFNPPLMGSGNYGTNNMRNMVAGRGGNTVHQHTPPMVVYQDATSTTADIPISGGRAKKERSDRERSDRERSDRDHREPGEGRKHRDRELRERDLRHKIIPPDEDMKRLRVECKAAIHNAGLLSEALAMATVEDLEQDIIVIPWASAGAERSRAAKDARDRDYPKRRADSNGHVPEKGDEVAEVTPEEELLAELLAANEQLVEALKQFDDLKRVALERETEDRSRREERQLINEEGTLYPDAHGQGSSRSRSQSPIRHALPTHPSADPALNAGQHIMLAVPPAPQGPRSPGLTRTPSPAQPDGFAPVGAAELANGYVGTRVTGPRDLGRPSFEDGERWHGQPPPPPPPPQVHQPSHATPPQTYALPPHTYAQTHPSNDELPDVLQPSAKALGKRRVEPDSVPAADPPSSYNSDNFEDRLSDSEDEESPAKLWQHMHHPVQHYVYDAAAERTQERLKEAHLQLVH
ncbi:unnamed protein product [Mycena citricolor]|uniref:VHS domain-containing protein n=1 Tax=Mycena citricolor TaxID=2018698 RepID=A0AAD2H7N6_9AGAR|nr:unnamed protein product [Mycena citricolor]